MYYPCSENKGVDQLRSYCEADLHLCFSLCRLLVFPCGGLYGFLSLQYDVNTVQTSKVKKGMFLYFLFYEIKLTYY